MSNTSIQPAAAGGSFAGAAPLVFAYTVGAAALALTGNPPGVVTSLNGPLRQTLGLPGGVFSCCNIVGALQVKSSPGILTTISCVTAGTISIHDCIGAAASVAGNLVGAFAMLSGSSLTVNWPMSSGIYVSAVSAGAFALAFS